MTRRPRFPVSRWALYRNDPEADEHPEAFEVSDLLEYPTLAWWRKANPPAPLIADKRKRPRPPTDAAYWRNRTPARLVNPSPLPGEGKARAKQRVTQARRYLARLRDYQYRTRHARRRERPAHWRIALRGYVVAATPGQGVGKIADGRQFSPWSQLAPGAHVPDADIRARYLETARRAVAITATHAPQWADTLGTFTPARGYSKSDAGVIFPDGSKRNAGVLLEVQR